MVELIWEERGLLRRMSGTVSREELDSSAQELQSSERTDSLRYIIHDFSACSAIELDDDDAEFMAVRAGIALLRNTRVKIAFVGEQPLVHQLIAAFNGSGISKLRCHHFDSLEAARRFTAD